MKRKIVLALAGVVLLGAAATGAGLAAVGAAAGPVPVVPAVPEHSDVPCGVPTLVTVPESTDEVTYEGFPTTYGYFKVVATLTDQSDTFALDGTGYRSTPIAPYRAEHLTQVVEPCRDADPVVPILPAPAPAPEDVPSGDPAPAPQPEPGCYP